MRIPRTYAIPWEAYQRYLDDDQHLIAELQKELTKVTTPSKMYAVRSSASLEDGQDRSFAGQFKSVLHVQDVDHILLSIWSVWSSAQTQAVKTYLDRHGIPTGELSMGVIVQEMVMPVFSGVSLSRNPITGGDEVVLEAIEGEGTQLVQDGHTPDRWVNKWGYWMEKPETSKLPQILIEEIISQTRFIAKKLGHPVDLEWVYDGQDLYWVQARAITTLNNRNIFSNYIPREVFPGMIKPLIFSINVPLVNTVWINWISEITGDLGIKPEDLTKSFYYRAYFNMGILGDIFEGLGFPRESMEMLMGSLPRGAARPSFKPSARTFSRLPWLIAFAMDKWNFGPKMRRALPGIKERIEATPSTGLEAFSESELLSAIERHYTLVQETAYYNVIGPLLMGMYNSALKAQLNKKGVDFSHFDLTEGMPEIAELDPAMHLRRLNEEFLCLAPELQKRIREANFLEVQKISEASGFFNMISRFMERFGHLSDNGNDFSAVPWREKPEIVLQMVINFEPPRVDRKKVTLADLRAGGRLNYPIKLFYKRAREFRLLREQVSGMYTHGYGLFRYFFLALGSHFVQRGLIDAEEDIFYLTYSQVRDLVHDRNTQWEMRPVIACHKADMERYRDILVPTVIYGDTIPPVREPNMEVLSGIPTSIGRHTGPVKVVRGIQDFEKVSNGDVLVIPYSDVGWTPLFARAGAVVAESGGLLSHSSIVAREYNIPAVVSVDGATLLPDETLVTVDGHKGEILIHK
jgi:pyruvate,water dikinase